MKISNLCAALLLSVCAVTMPSCGGDDNNDPLPEEETNKDNGEDDDNDPESGSTEEEVTASLIGTWCSTGQVARLWGTTLETYTYEPSYLKSVTFNADGTMSVTDDFEHTPENPWISFFFGMSGSEWSITTINGQKAISLPLDNMIKGVFIDKLTDTDLTISIKYDENLPGDPDVLILKETFVRGK